MRRQIFWTGILLITLVGATGCVPAAPLTEETSPIPTDLATKTSTTSPPNETEMPVQEAATALPQQRTKEPTMTSKPVEGSNELETKLISLARQDLAKHLSIDLEGIELIALEALNWPDASLGCPQPNIFYAQVLTPGYRINLQADGEMYSYHTDMDARLILCDPFSQSPVKGTPDTRS